MLHGQGINRPRSRQDAMRINRLQPIDFESHNRRTSIGGSEVAAAMGLHNYKTPLKLWSEKVGLIPEEDLSKLPAVISGTLLEPVIFKMFLDRQGIDSNKVMECAGDDAKTLQHPLLPWMTFSPDGYALDGSFGIEIKNVGYRMLSGWGVEGTDDIPVMYLLQVVWGSIVTRIPHWYIVAQLGTEQRVYEYHKNIQLERQVLRKVARFWKYNVLGRNAPSANEDDAKTVKALFQKPVDEIRIAKGDEIDLMHQYAELEPKFRKMEKTKKSLMNKLKQAIGDSSGVTDGDFTASWKKAFSWKKEKTK